MGRRKATGFSCVITYPFCFRAFSSAAGLSVVSQESCLKRWQPENSARLKLQPIIEHRTRFLGSIVDQDAHIVAVVCHGQVQQSVAIEVSCGQPERTATAHTKLALGSKAPVAHT